MNGLIVGELFRECPEQGKNGNETPVLPNLHIEDVDLQRIADLRAFHVNRAGDEVWTGSGRKCFQRLQIIGGNAAEIVGKGFFSAGGETVKRDGVAGIHGQNGWVRAVEIPPNHVFRGGRNFVSSGHAELQPGIFKQTRGRGRRQGIDEGPICVSDHSRGAQFMPKFDRGKT